MTDYLENTSYNLAVFFVKFGKHCNAVNEFLLQNRTQPFQILPSLVFVCLIIQTYTKLNHFSQN